MKALISPLGGIVLMAAGAAGLWWEFAPAQPHALALLTAGLALILYTVLRTTYVGADRAWSDESGAPRPLRLTSLDYVKALICWLDAFKRTYAVKPGLYYTGKTYDRDAPLLVTANYLLTVLLVVRRVRAQNARLLVVDSDGINVWCAAGKGRFGHDQIIQQLSRYDRETLMSGKKLRLILPKLALSGVNLNALRDTGIRPIIGPVYARDLPGYLAAPPWKNRSEDRVVFGLRARAFTWLPGLIQAIGTALMILFALIGIAWAAGIATPWRLVWINALVATAYPLLFPWIPGTRFAVKGLALAAAISLALIAAFFAGGLSPGALIMALPYVLTVSLLFALSYTGNSAVSNYTRVRREIASFLPLNVGFAVASLAAYVIVGILS